MPTATAVCLEIRVAKGAPFSVRILVAPEQDTFHRGGQLVWRILDTGDLLKQEHRHHQAPGNCISGKTAIEQHEQIKGNESLIAYEGEIGGKRRTEEQGDQMHMPGVKIAKGRSCLPHLRIKLAGRRIARAVIVPQQRVIRNSEGMLEPEQRSG